MNCTEKSTFTLPVFSLLCAMLFASLTTGCSSVPKSYSAAPLGGRVVDIKTREPIAGAYVVAIYKVEMGMEAGWPGALHFEETRTDHEGRFHFSGVEKMTVPKEWLARNARLYSSDPELYVFADGYDSSLSGGALDKRRWLLTHRVSTVDGDDFPLRTSDSLTFKEKYYGILSDLGPLKGIINTYINPSTGERISCTFETIPMTWSYFSEQIRRLEREWNKNYPKFIVPHASDCTKQGE